MHAGEEKFKIGLERLAKADDDPDLLGAALTSIHGALEDRFRHVLVTTPDVPERDHQRILDVKRVQWGELIDLMRLYAGLSAEHATLVRTMNRERQSVAHGGRFRGRRVAVERYATFALTYFPNVTTAALDLTPAPPPAKPVSAPRPAPARTQQRPRTQNDAQKPAKAPAARAPAAGGPSVINARSSGAGRAAPAARKPRAAAPKQLPLDLSRRAASNPGLVLTVVLVLIVGCYALGSLIQTETRGRVPAASSLPAEPGPQARRVPAELNLRAEPGLNTPVLAVMPAGSQVTLLEGEQQREDHRWVRVRYGDQEGWADADLLQEP
jgi:hypothetical protein